jgi:hypothetical protein
MATCANGVLISSLCQCRCGITAYTTPRQLKALARLL